MKVSIVVPVYNEIATLEECLDRVMAVDLDLEVIAVNDGSVDGSTEVLARLAEKYPALSVLTHERNSGKGAALKTGFSAVTGDFVIIQDADLEYDPADFKQLLAPLFEGRADVVYGSRFKGGDTRVHLYHHYVGNRVLTWVSNIFTNLNLTDMETCYKAFRREVVALLDLQSRSFTVEPEITAKVARMKARVFEVPISYAGRDFSEGKKIHWTDGFAALWAIVKFRFVPRRIPRLDPSGRRSTREGGRRA